jgi:hypothetical protein
MNRFIGVVICVLASAMFAHGTCHPVFVRQHAVAAVVHHQQAAIIIPAPYPVYTASGSYGPSELAAVVEELKKIRAEVAALRGGGKMPPAEPDKEDGPVQVPFKTSLIQQDCARCHSDSAIKGGGHVFFKGGKSVMTPEQLGESIGTVLTGKMPKDRKYTAEQKVEASRELVGAK